MNKKKNKNLFGFFEQQQSDVTDKIHTEIDSDKRNKKSDQKAGQVNMNKGTEQYNSINNVLTEQQQKTSNRSIKYEYKQGIDKENKENEQETEQVKSFIEQFQKKVSRPTVEQTHRRQTYLIDKELISRMERLAKKQPKGFKTAVVNEGIRRVLDEIETQRKKDYRE